MWIDHWVHDGMELYYDRVRRVETVRIDHWVCLEMRLGMPSGDYVDRPLSTPWRRDGIGMMVYELLFDWCLM